MISNINTIQTSTFIPVGFLKKEQRRILRKCSSCFASHTRKQKKRTHAGRMPKKSLSSEKRMIANVVSTMLSFTVEGIMQRSDKHELPNTKHSQQSHGIHELPTKEGNEPVQLYFVNSFLISLPNTMQSLVLTDKDEEQLNKRIKEMSAPAMHALNRFRRRRHEKHADRAFIRSMEFDSWFVNVCCLLDNQVQCVCDCLSIFINVSLLANT